MTNQADVKSYLQKLKQKISVFGIIFRDELSKNAQTLLDLEISVYEREKIIQNLTVDDYSEGPTSETLYDLPPMWIFGKLVKKKEVYIKITMGRLNSEVICISFHITARLLNYPFKT